MRRKEEKVYSADSLSKRRTRAFTVTLRGRWLASRTSEQKRQAMPVLLDRRCPHSEGTVVRSFRWRKDERDAAVVLGCMVVLRKRVSRAEEVAVHFKSDLLVSWTEQMFLFIV